MNLQDKINDCVPELIQFYIANYTNSNYEINLTNPNFSANATTRYQFDVTNSDFNSSLEGSIVINGITYVFNYGANGIDSFVNALNDLGFGFFFISTSGVNTYINVYDNTNVYGSLNIATTIYTEVNTIADLRLINGTNNIQTYVDVLGYYSFNGDGGGRFYWNSTSTATDDGGSVIQATGVAVGRWYRIFDNLVSVKYFGATGDNVTNDNSSLVNAWRYCGNTKFDLFIPKGSYNIYTRLEENLVGFSVVGEKFQSIITSNLNSSTLILLDVNNSKIENISVKNYFTNASEDYPSCVSMGAFQYSVYNFKFINCYITNPNCNTDAFDLFVGNIGQPYYIYNILIENNIFENIGRAVSTHFGRSEVQDNFRFLKFIGNTTNSTGVKAGGIYGKVGFVISYDGSSKNLRTQYNFQKNWEGGICYEIVDTSFGIFSLNLWGNGTNGNDAPMLLGYGFADSGQIPPQYLMIANNITSNGKIATYSAVSCNFTSNIFTNRNSLVDTACSMDIRASSVNLISNNMLTGWNSGVFSAKETIIVLKYSKNNLYVKNLVYTTNNDPYINYGFVFYLGGNNNYVFYNNVYAKNSTIYDSVIFEYESIDNLGLNNFFKDTLVNYP
jgi:hypothetical protein